MRVRQKNEKVNKKKILKIIVLTFILSVCTMAFYLVLLSSTLHLDDEKLQSLSTPVSIFDLENTEINFGASYPYVAVKDLSEDTKNAFISIEDSKFYSHKGVNIGRMAKAMLNNIKSNSIVEGASTISQQLIKNTHLSNEKTYSRKVKEILLTLKLEQNYSKDEILEMYLNAIYFGSGCYGIESASQFYYGKSAKDLTLNESAVLAGVIKSPTYLSPINYDNACLDRKNLVLAQMHKQGKITSGEYQNAKNLGLQLKISKTSSANKEYLNASLTEASEILNISKNALASSKYKIYTYLDKNTQSILSNNTITDNAMYNGIIIDNETGGINGFCSSLEYGGASVKRTPASCLKPILVYAPMIESGDLYFDSILDDKPKDFGGYSPHNINDKYYDKITASKALALSLNIPAVELLEQNGIEKSKAFARKLGIQFDEKDNGLALALGAMTNGVNITDLCNAYSPFANNGKFTKSTLIRKITDQNGKVIYMHNPAHASVMKDSTAYLVGEMMRKTVTEGTCKALNALDFEIRAKSGTNGTDDKSLNTDMLCVAQTTKHTSCVWYYALNHDKENLLSTSLGNEISPTIKLKSILSELYKNITPEKFKKPNSVIETKIDRLSFEKGDILLASKDTPERYTMSTLFDIVHKPSAISDNFTNVKQSVLTAKKMEQSVELRFATVIHQSYKLIKKEYVNNRLITQTTLLEKSESDDYVEYLDTDIKQNAKYEYYLEITQKSGLKEQSNKATVFFKSKASNTDTYRWYF